jgi:hypothetical protein
MKGFLHYTDKGWMVKHTVWTEDKSIAFNGELPLHPCDCKPDWIKEKDGKEIEFTMQIDCVVGCSGTCGTCHHAEKYARLDKIIEKIATDSKLCDQHKKALEKLEELQNEFVAYKIFDELFKEDSFPNHTNRDIWVRGFMVGLNYIKK